MKADETKRKREILLGINPCIYGLNYHDPAVVVLIDGRVVFGVEEERCNRVKHSKGVFPSLALAECLTYCNLTWDDIDAVVIGYEPALWMNRLNIELLDIINPFVSCVSNSIQIRGSEIVEKIIRTNIVDASGLDASVVVWVVASAREEHASAIEWLNKHTTSDVDFFLIEVHAYTIGDSAPAPMFKVIEQPNDFAKSVKSLANSGDLNESQVRRLEFWNMLNDALDQKGKPFNKHKATTDHWYTVAVGSSQCYISIDLVNKEHKIRVGLWVTDNKEMFDMFYSHREEIEAVFGEPLDWDRLDNKKASIFSTSIPGLNFNKQDNYPELIDLAIEKTVKLREAIKPFLN